MILWVSKDETDLGGVVKEEYFVTILGELFLFLNENIQCMLWIPIRSAYARPF